jgi:hypothetical protein
MPVPADPHDQLAVGMLKPLLRPVTFELEDAAVLRLHVPLRHLKVRLQLLDLLNQPMRREDLAVVVHHAGGAGIDDPQLRPGHSSADSSHARIGQDVASPRPHGPSGFIRRIPQSAHVPFSSSAPSGSTSGSSRGSSWKRSIRASSSGRHIMRPF